MSNQLKSKDELSALLKTFITVCDIVYNEEPQLNYIISDIDEKVIEIYYDRYVKVSCKPFTFKVYRNLVITHSYNVLVTIPEACKEINKI